jgi:hypothetical protein
MFMNNNSERRNTSNSPLFPPVNASSRNQEQSRQSQQNQPMQSNQGQSNQRIFR